MTSGTTGQPERAPGVPQGVTAPAAAPASPALTEVVLRDGTAGLLWPLLPSDRGTLRHGFDQLSAASRQRRFLTALSELSEPMLARLVDGVDGVEHVALVLTVVPADGEARPVAVGRLVRHADIPTAADVAITVQDDWQGRGAATALLRALVARRPAGVAELRTVVADDNAASLAMLASLGRLSAHRAGHGLLDVRVRDLLTA